MTVQQMRFFYNACISLGADDVDKISMGVARVMTDKAGSREIEQALTKIRSTFVANLIRS